MKSAMWVELRAATLNASEGEPIPAALVNVLQHLILSHHGQPEFGAARVAAVAGVWARTAQVWRDDEGALNRTMAEIDRLLKRADKALGRVGAGWSG